MPLLRNHPKARRDHFRSFRLASSGVNFNNHFFKKFNIKTQFLNRTIILEQSSYKCLFLLIPGWELRGHHLHQPQLVQRMQRRRLHLEKSGIRFQIGPERDFGLQAGFQSRRMARNVSKFASSISWNELQRLLPSSQMCRWKEIAQTFADWRS